MSTFEQYTNVARGNDFKQMNEKAKTITTALSAAGAASALNGMLNIAKTYNYS